MYALFREHFVAVMVRPDGKQTPFVILQVYTKLQHLPNDCHVVACSNFLSEPQLKVRYAFHDSGYGDAITPNQRKAARSHLIDFPPRTGSAKHRLTCQLLAWHSKDALF